MLYRLHLGFVLGKRFVLLEHRGRRSGLIRRVVIEVVDHDPRDGSVVVAAAWGKKADWYENILADPHITMTLGSERYSAIAATLTKSEAEAHLRNYARRHPVAFKELDRLVEGGGKRQREQIIAAFVETMPLVVFHPTSANGGDAGDGG
jgi:deazaflavin-dependent oxidoreductase (nitroreductase family)